MKKIFLFLPVVCFLLACTETYSPTVNNKSSYDVSFTLTTGYRTQNIALLPNESYVHEPMPISLQHSLVSFGPAEYVYFESESDYVYTFYDIPEPELPEPIPAFIYNTLSIDVILSADGAISTDPITIKANEEVTTETIIKANPSFSAITTNGYPVVVDYIFTENEDKTEYKIILR